MVLSYMVMSISHNHSSNHLRNHKVLSWSVRLYSTLIGSVVSLHMYDDEKHICLALDSSVKAISRTL